MPNDDPRRWEQHLRAAAAHAEEDLRRVVTYINDEVVPDIRRNGSHALRFAAAELQKLAQHMDDDRAAASARNQANPAQPPKDKPKP